jgi:hypothetical protein
VIEVAIEERPLPSDQKTWNVEGFLRICQPEAIAAWLR